MNEDDDDNGEFNNELMETVEKKLQSTGEIKRGSHSLDVSINITIEKR